MYHNTHLLRAASFTDGIRMTCLHVGMLYLSNLPEYYSTYMLLFCGSAQDLLMNCYTLALKTTFFFLNKPQTTVKQQHKTESRNGHFRLTYMQRCLFQLLPFK